VCRRARRRGAELGLDGLAAYRSYLERHPDEWRALDAMANITISRFHRDHGVFAFLQSDVLPALTQRAKRARRDGLRAWSAGCASGEEAHSLAIMWRLAIAPAADDMRLEILATDVEPAVLRRAREGRYPPSAVRELPEAWRAAALDRHDDAFVVRPEYRRLVRVAHHDIRATPPNGPFDLVLCRNVAFTYFDGPRQRETVRRLAGVTLPGAALVIGAHEALPAGERAFAPWAAARCVYRRTGVT
jgi:chemotaxis protein methyltransferase CheR